MASTRTRANTAIQTRPVFSGARILLSPAKAFEFDRKDSSSPPFASVRHPTVHSSGDLVLANKPWLSSPNAIAPAESKIPHARNQEGEKDRENNEPHTMFASPATTSWHSPVLGQAAPEITTREVAYAASAPGSPVLSTRPPRHDSAYFSGKDRDDGSEVDSEVQARQLRARERVVILRAKVLRTRRIRKERKGQLRYQRDRARDAIDKLTQKINELVALGKLDHLQADLSPYYDELRTAQDELGPAEDAYDNLESRLDEEEQDLEEEEEHFYRHNDILSQNALSLDVAESKLDDELSPLVRPYHPPEVEFEEISLEDQKVQDYLAKIEEAERLKEGLDDLETDYYRISVESNFRKRHAIPLSAETIEFLKGYPEEYKESLDNLHRVEDALLDLRDECIDQGLFNESEYRYESRDALCEEVMDAVDEARERSALRVAADHHHNKETNFGDKRDYVNKWLLDWVPDSTIDKIMLQSFIYFEVLDTPHKSEDLDDDRWADLVIENWDRDRAGDMANVYFNASKLDAITGEPAGTGNLGAISTTRSRSNIYGYGSAVSLDVILDDEGSFDDARTENGSFTTQKHDLELIPATQNHEPLASTETTPKSIQVERPTLFISHPPPKAASLNAFDMSPDHTSRALDLSVEPSKRARSALPEYRSHESPSIQRKVTFFETEGLSTLRNDASSIADPPTPFESNGQFADIFAQDDHEATDNSFLHSNASILSDLFIPLNHVLL